MTALTQTLAPWHEYYALLGQASATMTGLLFVAASVGSHVFAEGRRGAQRMFLSASVVQFASTLAGCLAVLLPLRSWYVLGGCILAGGVFGLVYSAAAWRDAVRDGLIEKIDLEDRLWYAAAPAVMYLAEASAGLGFGLQQGFACPVLAAAMAGLLFVAIHNAWDITLWSVTRRRD